MTGITEFFIWILFLMVAGELVWKAYEHRNKVQVHNSVEEFVIAIKKKELEEEKKNKD
jgi:hypothetical protein